MKNIVFIGKESVGKSQLIQSLSGKNVTSQQMRGTTLYAQTYKAGKFQLIDTPGILLHSDSETTKVALKEIPGKDCVALVISATDINKDLKDLLPIVKDRIGVVVITRWDMVKNLIKQKDITQLEQELGVPVYTVDARNLSENEKKEILKSFVKPKKFSKTTLKTQIKTTVTPKKGIFDIPIIGKVLAFILLFLPAWVAVQFAIWLADSFYDTVFNALAEFLGVINTWPAPINHLLGMDYGLVAMFPFLVLYALPTVFLFAAIISLYKTSGLIDKLTVSIHHLVIRFGLTGRDIVRVIMGFGCNVPAVINTRSCSSCTRGNCISAISFGAACSYQLPATIAVFAAAKMEFLIIPYLLVLAGSTLIYLYFTKARVKKPSQNKLTLLDRDFLQVPKIQPMLAEGKSMVMEFLTVAFPIFAAICLIAGLLDWLGIIAGLSWILAPLMMLFNLPAEAATAVILGSIRKDGIAIGLLDSSWEGLKVPSIDPVQVLTIVYLAGVLLPCLVTLYTIYKEMDFKFALKTVYKQTLAAIAFSLIIAWGGYWLF